MSKREEGERYKFLSIFLSEGGVIYLARPIGS